MAALDKREKFLPIISRCFAENGYRGTTTAKLARLCKVRENVLYRIWPSKKEMFLDCIEHIYEVTMDLWNKLSEDTSDRRTLAERVLAYQAEDHGLLRYYRIVFAGLLEDDADIRKALRELYRRFHAYISLTTRQHREKHGLDGRLDCDTTAWALMGVAAMVDIQCELRILPARDREGFLCDAGSELLDRSQSNPCTRR
jgi:AcrR family transcriptional regulator